MEQDSIICCPVPFVITTFTLYIVFDTFLRCKLILFLLFKIDLSNVNFLQKRRDQLTTLLQFQRQFCSHYLERFCPIHCADTAY